MIKGFKGQRNAPIYNEITIRESLAAVRIDKETLKEEFKENRLLNKSCLGSVLDSIALDSIEASFETMLQTINN